MRAHIAAVVCIPLMFMGFSACGSSSGETKDDESGTSATTKTNPTKTASRTGPKLLEGLGGSFISNRGSGSSASCSMEAARDAATIKGCVRSQHDGIRACYVAALVGDESLSGAIRVRLVIDMNGGVEDSSLVKSTLNDGDMERCVLKAVDAWTFPAGDNKLAIEYPFKFRPASE